MPPGDLTKTRTMAQKRKKSENELGDLSFEKAIENLTQIVDRIETGQIPLAESLQQYEKGMAMIAHCRRILLDAEKRIEQVAEGQERAAPDENEDDDEQGQADDSDADESLF